MGDNPQVRNQRHNDSRGFYIGRPSKWGNPFEIGRDGDRAEVIEKFRGYAEKFTEEELTQLRGKDLVCWCAPNACHGDILLELANG
jgi:hypothetical protein